MRGRIDEVRARIDLVRARACPRLGPDDHTGCVGPGRSKINVSVLLMLRYDIRRTETLIIVDFPGQGARPPAPAGWPRAANAESGRAVSGW